MPSVPSVHHLRCILRARRYDKVPASSVSLHACMCKIGLHAHSSLGNYLVSLMVATEHFDGAVWVFNELTCRTSLSWNSLIFGYVNRRELQHALILYQEMQEMLLYPDECSILGLLKACAQLKDVSTGSILHAEVARRGLEEHLLVSSSLVDMYAKCNSLTKAQETFDKLVNRDVVAWNVLIAGYTRVGHWEEALLCFKQMLSEGNTPSISTLVCGLKACAGIGNAERGGELHAEIARLELESDPHVGSALVDMYASCGLLLIAEEALDKLSTQQVAAWNALLGGYIKHGLHHEALTCFKEMQLKGIIPNAITFVCSVKASGVVGDIEIGIELHGDIARTGLQDDVSVGSALIDMYADWGMLPRAQEVLLKLVNRNAVCWNALIAGYVKHGFSQRALDCVEQMQLESLSPTTVTYASSLKACGDIKAIDKGYRLHIEIVKKEMDEDIFVGSSLVDMYADIGLLCEAQEVFNRLPTHNVVSWTALIGGYAKHGFDKESLEHFNWMQLEGVFANSATYACCLKSCGSLGATDKGFDIHVEIARKGLESDLLVGNALVDMYAKCGLLRRAHETFLNLPTRDVVSWNALIGGYTKDGSAEEALGLFEQMQREGISPDAITFSCSLNACGSAGARAKGQEIHYEIDKMGLLEGDLIVGNALVDMYVNCGLLSKAKEVFDKLPARDVVSWTTLIAGCVNHEQHEEALQYYEKMEQSGIFPNSVTFVSSLRACGNMGLTDKGQTLHAEIMRKDLLECDLVGNSLVDLYAKCGMLSKAHEVFEVLSVQDAVSWNTLITGHAHLGTSESVFCLFDRMVDDMMDPNTSTFLSVLNACSHAGVVEDGVTIFGAMRDCYCMVQSIEHYNCMADLFARSGQVQKACTIIREMPFHPNPVVWHTVMNACQTWGDMELGREAFEQAVQIDDKDAGAFLFLAKVFSEANLQGKIRKEDATRQLACMAQSC
ncbi:hypothetical protein GOP47_0006649 [Adiantum capillus-veneris]|uniref:Pentatricopeptide repeat-containing protein n=1 Tax=Adiantum capillus-veneris TaxID=13818 RepID=A0A9D4V497_ADICA|nr:hypothetical protein GOP47_0006649 [Adiantum capillus-veneris]